MTFHPSLSEGREDVKRIVKRVVKRVVKRGNSLKGKGFGVFRFRSARRETDCETKDVKPVVKRVRMVSSFIGNQRKGPRVFRRGRVFPEPKPTSARNEAKAILPLIRCGAMTVSDAMGLVSVSAKDRAVMLKNYPTDKIQQVCEFRAKVASELKKLIFR